MAQLFVSQVFSTNHRSVPKILSVHGQITHWCKKLASHCPWIGKLFKVTEQLAFAYIKDVSVCVMGWCFHYLMLRTPEEPPYLMSQTFDWCASAYSGVDLWFAIYHILLWSWTRVVTSEFDLTDTLKKLPAKIQIQLCCNFKTSVIWHGLRWSYFPIWDALKNQERAASKNIFQSFQSKQIANYYPLQLSYVFAHA